MGPSNLKTKSQSEAEFVVTAEVRKMTLEAVRTSTEKSRDEGVKNLAASPQWFGLLPDVIEPEKAGRPVRIISPEKYLTLAIEVEEGKFAEKPSDALVVDGDFDLRQKRGIFFLSGEQITLSKEAPLVSLPPAVIRGDLRISGAENLREIHCSVTGDAALQNCPKLEKIQGECFGFARFANCGMEYLAAGYRCAGDLRVRDCKNLRVINCEVGGNLIVSSSPLGRTGAGLRVGGDMVVTCHENLLEMKGEVLGHVCVDGLGFIRPQGMPRGTPASQNPPTRREGYSRI